MIQEKRIMVIASYRDPGIIERTAANFRRLWIDLDRLCYRRSGENCIIEMTVSSDNSDNLAYSIYNLSKMVDVERVSILDSDDNILLTYSGGEVLGEGLH
ncbi:hypothetical protein [Picrophilus oshimae]|nr:hypothetical protein [Picrophilus oshimae]